MAQHRTGIDLLAVPKRLPEDTFRGRIVVYGTDVQQAVAQVQRFFGVAQDAGGTFGPYSRLLMWQILEAIRAGETA